MDYKHRKLRPKKKTPKNKTQLSSTCTTCPLLLTSHRICLLSPGLSCPELRPLGSAEDHVQPHCQPCSRYPRCSAPRLSLGLSGEKTPFSPPQGGRSPRPRASKRAAGEAVCVGQGLSSPKSRRSKYEPFTNHTFITRTSQGRPDRAGCGGLG